MADYNPSIPQPTDNLSTSQGQMLNNFTQLNNIFDFDHYTWNDATVGNRGLHRQIHFPATTSQAAQAGTASVLYSKAVSGVSSLYFDNAVGSSAVWRGGAANGLVGLTTGGTLSNGLMTMPNGLIFQWGFNGGISDGSSISFPTPFPNNCFNISLTGLRGNNQIRSLWVNQSFSRTSFVVQTSTTLTVMWMAVGN
jgi:hypothetical protein